MSFLVNLRKSELYSFYKRWYCFRFDHMTAMYFTDHPFTYIISVQPVGYTLDRWVDEDFCLYWALLDSKTCDLYYAKRLELQHL